MNNLSKKLDGYFIAVILQLFIVTLLFLFNGNIHGQYLHFVMLMITYFTVIITYVGGMVVGLILTSIFIFGYASYLFYLNLVNGVEVEFFSYIWMVAIPMLALTSGKIAGVILQLQETNKKLQQDYASLVTIDKETGLGNIKSFYESLSREMSRSKRRQTPCVLLIIKLPYFKEMRTILGEEDTNRLRKALSKLIMDSTRNEDERYTLENDTIAIIMPDTDKEGAIVVKERIKTSMNNLNIRLREQKKYVNIDTKVAILQYTERMKTAIEFKTLAEEELQYDV